MSDWLDIWIVHKVAGVFVLSFIVINITNYSYGIYKELIFSFQINLLVVSVLSAGSILQGTGGIGIFQPSNATLKQLAFGALYTVSGVELLLYLWSSIVIESPDVCATVVTASGGDPVQLTLGEVCFLLVLGCFQWCDTHV